MPTTLPKEEVRASFLHLLANALGYVPPKGAPSTNSASRPPRLRSERVSLWLRSCAGEVQWEDVAAVLGNAAGRFKAGSGRHALLVIDGADLLVENEDFVKTLVKMAKARHRPV